jgi:transposase
MRWQDMPERYGKYKTTHKRFTRWAATGVWDRIFADLLKDRQTQTQLPSHVVIDNEDTGLRLKRVSNSLSRISQGKDEIA